MAYWLRAYGLRTKKVTDKQRAKTRKGSIMYQLFCIVWTVNLVYSGFFQFRVCRHGNALWCGWWKWQFGPRIVDRTTFKSRDSVCANIYICGTASPRSWYLQPQTHDRCHDRTERIRQAEEKILERVAEEPDTDCPRCVIYCKWLLKQCRESPNFLKCILFTDEAGFPSQCCFQHSHFMWWKSTRS